MHYKELAHAITEADKSQDLQSASWRHRKNRCFNLVWRQEKNNPSPKAVLFYSFSGLQLTGWDRATLGRAICSLPIWMLISFRNTVTDTPRITFDQMCQHPVASQVDTYNYPSHHLYPPCHHSSLHQASSHLADFRCGTGTDSWFLPPIPGSPSTLGSFPHLSLDVGMKWPIQRWRILHKSSHTCPPGPAITP